MKKLFLAALLALLSCSTPEEDLKYKNDHTYDIMVYDIKSTYRNSTTYYYFIDTRRNIFEVSETDFLRYGPGDSMRVFYDGNREAEVLMIYPTKKK